jgi:nitrogen fixation protein FixH
MKLRMHWGLAVAMFYTAFALSTVGFVAFAMTRDVDLVSEDYYARALAHDRHMQAVANGDAIGTTATVTVASGQVRLHLPEAMVPDTRGTATLYRASDARADRAVALRPSADGAIVIPTTGLAPGRWQLRIQWSSGGRDYYLERGLRLP